MGFLKAFIINVTILVLFITFMPGLLPDVPINKAFKTTKVTLDGILTPNKKLDKVEILFKGDILGPESFTDDKNFLYTSLHSGDIVKISGKHIVPVVQFGKPCKGAYEERICGRPLGIRFGNDGFLYAADAYYGIYKVNVETGQKTKLVSFGQEIDGKPAKLPNSVAVSCNGDIYWTDSSSNFMLQDGVFAFMDDPSGRLIHYNAKTGKNKVLTDGILFANGVALSKNEDFVIVSDARNQILRHYLRGPKAGTTETFVQLPGIPDNIQTDGGSGFLVSVITESNAENPNFFGMLSQFPSIRRFFVRSLSLAELGFRYVDKLYPNVICQKTMHFVGHFTSVMNLVASRSVILHVSENGKIMDALWTHNASIKAFSEAHIVKNHLYLGSPFNDYLGRIPLSEIGWEHLNRKLDSFTSVKHSCSGLYGEDEKIKEAPKTSPPKQTTTAPTSTKPTTQKQTVTTQKPTTTTQKPTTTTQKPTTATQKPTSTAQKPTSTAQKPTATAQKPTSTAQKPTSTAQKPTSTAQKPTTSSQKTTEKVVTSTQKPSTSKQAPTTATPKPITTTQKPVETASDKPTTPPKPETKAPTTSQTKPVVSKKPSEGQPSSGEENKDKRQNEKISESQKRNTEGKKVTSKPTKNEL